MYVSVSGSGVSRWVDDNVCSPPPKKNREPQKRKIEMNTTSIRFVNEIY